MKQKVVLLGVAAVGIVVGAAVVWLAMREAGLPPLPAELAAIGQELPEGCKSDGPRWKAGFIDIEGSSIPRMWTCYLSLDVSGTLELSKEWKPGMGVGNHGNPEPALTKRIGRFFRDRIDAAISSVMEGRNRMLGDAYLLERTCVVRGVGDSLILMHVHLLPAYWRWGPRQVAVRIWVVPIRGRCPPPALEHG